MVICLERGADLHMAQLMPLPLTVSCFSKIQIGFTFLVPVLGIPGKRAVKRVCVCVVTSPNPKRHFEHSAILAQLMVMSNEQTHTHTNTQTTEHQQQQAASLHSLHAMWPA